MEPLVLTALDGPIATLTINRPDSLNSLNEATLHALGAAVTSLDLHQVRCVIITGAGEKAFVAGADIAVMSAMSEQEALAFSRLGQEVLSSLEALACPVIAAVNGFALGGGCELALACDFIVASDKAKFGQPEVKLGVIPGYGGTQRLFRRIAPGLARELIYSGRMMLSEEALRVGLVNAVVPRRELLDRAREIALSIAAVGPCAVAAAKAVMRASDGQGLAAGLELEAKAFAACFAGSEQREGMRAFLEKREPAFQGR